MGVSGAAEYTEVYFLNIPYASLRFIQTHRAPPVLSRINLESYKHLRGESRMRDVAVIAGKAFGICRLLRVLREGIQY